MANVKNETIREPYEAPMIEDVPLRSDEQVLAGCKMPGTGGPSSPLPNNCLFAPCSQQGLS